MANDVRRLPLPRPGGKRKERHYDETVRGGGGATGIWGGVLVVDDDARTRTLLRGLLEGAGFTVREAVDGIEALRLVEEQRPDAVVIEVSIPGVAGYVVCRFLRVKFGERLPIVFLSGERIEPLDRTAGLLLGADDYVVKPFDPDELLARIQRLILRAGDTRALSPDSAGSRATDFELTPRESEVLKLLVEGSNQADIAHSLSISPNTVASHIQRILLKLGVRNRAQAIALATRGQPDQSDRVSDEKRLANVGDAEGSSSTA
jgi:DNA-binding NarL/FixJ family response regulator